MTYPPRSGLLQSVVSPDHETTNYAYVGNLVTSAATSRTVAGTVGYSYATDGSLSAIAVQTDNAGGTSQPMTYDLDGLIVSAGDLSLSRNSFGAISASVLNNVGESVSFDSLGQLAEDNLNQDNHELLGRSFSRDTLGRETDVTEAWLLWAA